MLIIPVNLICICRPICILVSSYKHVIPVWHVEFCLFLRIISSFAQRSWTIFLFLHDNVLLLYMYHFMRSQNFFQLYLIQVFLQAFPPLSLLCNVLLQLRSLLIICRMLIEWDILSNFPSFLFHRFVPKYYTINVCRSLLNFLLPVTFFQHTDKAWQSLVNSCQSVCFVMYMYLSWVNIIIYMQNQRRVTICNHVIGVHLAMD